MLSTTILTTLLTATLSITASATPLSQPHVSASHASSRNAFATWPNGEMGQVASWAIYGSNTTSKADMVLIGEPFEKTGGNTSVSVGTTPSMYCQVAALGTSGEELGRSGLMDMYTGEMVGSQ